MIQIEIPGKGFLQLPQAASISLKLNNPIFADDGFIPGDYSFPFDISGGENNSHNARLLAHPDVPESAIATYEIPGAKLYVEGNLYREGTLVVTKASRNKYNINFRFGFRNIRSDFGSFKIRDLVDEAVVITTETYEKKLVVDFGGLTLSEYKLKVNGDSYTAATLAALATAIAADNRVSATHLTTGDTYGITDPRIVISPITGAMEMQTEFTVEFETENGTWQYHITQNPGTVFYAAIADWLDAQLAEPSPYLFFPMVVWLNYLGGKGYPSDYVNAINDDGYIFPSGTRYMGAVYQPFISLKKVIERITDVFGVVFEGNFLDDLYYEKILFFNTKMMAEAYPYAYADPYMFYHTGFNVRDLLPDISVEDLLKGLQNKWNLSIVLSPSANRIAINYRKAVAIGTSYIDWTAISSPSNELDFASFVSGYKLTQPREGNDSLDSDDSYTIGIPGTEIPGNIGSIKQDISINGGRSGPYVGEEAGSDFIPRFFFYIGPTVADFVTYEKASHKGLEVVYAGVTGLGETQWKEWLHLMRQRVIASFVINLDYRHINRLDWSKKYIIDRTAYLIKSIDIKITSRGFEPARVEMYRV